MPVHAASKNGRPGYQWGSGAIYTYPPGDEAARKRAKQRAFLQGYAATGPHLAKFNPDQPRDPTGSSTGGQWTSGGATEADEQKPEGAGLEAQRTYVRGLNRQQKRALQEYTHLQYRTINEDLRRGGMDGASRPRIDETFDAAPPLEQEVTVWRGAGKGDVMAGLSAKERTKWLGGTVHDGGYVSATASADYSTRFGGETGVLYRITVSKGSRALPLSELSQHTAEQEVLLPRGHRFRVTGFGSYETDTRRVYGPSVAEQIGNEKAHFTVVHLRME